MVFRDINLCSKKLVDFWAVFSSAFRTEYPGWGIALNCTFRPPEEQFQFFCKGRDVKWHANASGRKIIDSAVVVDEKQIITKVDGVTRVGSHSTSPSMAFDVAIETPQGKWTYDYMLPQWKELGQFLVKGVVWGGNYKTLLDPPHMEDSDYWDKLNGGKIT